MTLIDFYLPEIATRFLRKELFPPEVKTAGEAFANLSLELLAELFPVEGRRRAVDEDEIDLLLHQEVGDATNHHL